MTLSFNTKILVFGGPYSNLEATQAMKRTASDLDIAPDHCVCSGDIVAYCADPQSCVDEIRTWGCHVVMGNCEDSLATDQNDCGCGFDEGTACDLLSKQWFAYAQSRITQDAKDWMAELPSTLTATFGGLRLQFVHGSAEQINQFIFASSPDEIFQAEFSRQQVDVIIGGHCGLPFARPFKENLWLNAGVIGMPANDGTPACWYAVLSLEESGAITTSFHRLDYDYESAATKMRQAHLSEGYARALETGLWPNLDILNDVERAQTGQPLTLPPLTWSKSSSRDPASIG